MSRLSASARRVLLELNPAYAQMALERITDDNPMFTCATIEQ